METCKLSVDHLLMCVCMRAITQVGAHFDSINSVGERSTWPENRAPGADDDGSGSAVVFEAFRAYVHSKALPARTLEFHW